METKTNIKISLQDFNINMLSIKALALLSEFALILYRRSGILIDVDSDCILSEIVDHAETCRDKRLYSIFLHIRAEIENHLINSKVGCDAIMANYLVGQLMANRVVEHKQANQTVRLT